MDNQLILEQFEEIERKVEKLIGTCKSLETANAELRSTIERLEVELQGRLEAENAYHQEKTLIRNKIDSLLHRLEERT